jgi:hypothetical protein
MTATNHVATGVLIAILAGNPWIALPLALVSHVVCDSMPHYGMDPIKYLRIFVPALLLDMTLAATILLVLLVTQPAHYQLLMACGILAASPDLLSIPFFIDILRHHFGAIVRFLIRIQWSETILPGLPIEVFYFGIVGVIILQHLR